MTAILISHRSTDNAHAKALKAWLEQQGHVRFFLDFDPAFGIPPGRDARFGFPAIDRDVSYPAGRLWLAATGVLGISGLEVDAELLRDSTARPGIAGWPIGSFCSWIYDDAKEINSKLCESESENLSDDRHQCKSGRREQPHAITCLHGLASFHPPLGGRLREPSRGSGWGYEQGRHPAGL
ncbi:MAG: hypothetical protein ACREJ5_04260 [Geminicoccaceae bacterium]